jgi:uncharacterized protein YukE
MASGNEVFMEVPAVKNMSKNFQQISQTLKQVCNTLQVLSNILKTTAFIGMVGGAVVAQFIDMIKPHIDKMSQKCAELSKDLKASAEAYERGDQQGATRFY